MCSCINFPETCFESCHNKQAVTRATSRLHQVGGSASKMAGRFLSDFSGDSGSSESSEGEDDIWMNRFLFHILPQGKQCTPYKYPFHVEKIKTFAWTP